MKRFTLGQRVLVKACGDGELVVLDPPALGRVTRLRRSDDAAWVALDERHANAAAHPFRAGDGDPRERNVLALAENCDAVKAGR